MARLRRPHEHALLGEESVSWRLTGLHRLLGLPTAVLLQLARPEIATAIAQHSDFERDPLGRFTRTFGTVATVRFGGPDEVAATLRRLDAVHAPVPSATDPELQLWVLATGIHVGIELERRFIGVLDDDARRAFYREQLSVFDAFGIDPRVVPADLDAFDAYVAATIASLEVVDDARRLGRLVVGLAGMDPPPGARAAASALTADLLPTALWSAFDLGRRPLPVVRAAHPVSRAVVRAVRPLRGRVPGRPGRRVRRAAARRVDRLLASA